MLLNVPGCWLGGYYGQAETNAEAWFNTALRPRKPEGSLGRIAQALTQLLNYDFHMHYIQTGLYCDSYS